MLRSAWGEPVNLDDEVSKGQENRNQQKRIFLFITASPRKSLGFSGTIANALEGDTYRSRHAMVCASSSPKKRDVEARLDYFGARRSPYTVQVLTQPKNTSFFRPSPLRDCGRYGAVLWSVALVSKPSFHTIFAF